MIKTGKLGANHKGCPRYHHVCTMGIPCDQCILMKEWGSQLYRIGVDFQMYYARKVVDKKVKPTRAVDVHTDGKWAGF